MASTDPWWIEPTLVVGGFIGTGLAALTAAFRKPREQIEPTGTASVVAASFVDKALLEQLILQLVSLNKHMADAAAYRHDEKIAREAAAHALIERGFKP